jgi:hypothetical protein
MTPPPSSPASANFTVTTSSQSGEHPEEDPMSQIIRNGDSRPSVVVTPERDGGVRIEEREPNALPSAALPYEGYLRVLDGRREPRGHPR